MNEVPMNDDLQLDSLIKKMAAEHQPELPSPGLIWWRAQVLKKQAEKERIERPFVIMRLVAAVVCLVVVAWLGISQMQGIRDVLGHLDVGPFTPLLAAGVMAAALLSGLLWRTRREA